MVIAYPAPRSTERTSVSHETGHCHAALYEVVRPDFSRPQSRRTGQPVALAHAAWDDQTSGWSHCPVARHFRHLAVAAQKRAAGAPIVLLALAYLQEDGLLLAVSFVVGVLSLLVFGY